MDAERRPIARSESLIIEEVGDEVLVYDLNDDGVHCLTPIAARVWRACDGSSNSSALAAELELGTDEVSQALAELGDRGLLEESPTLAVSAGRNGGYSRRDFGLRVVKAAAVTAAAPLIVSIAAPTAAQAQTPCIDLPFTGNCGVCNQLTGGNTTCCCCHNPSPFICTDTPEECCALPGATHCTEGAGRPTQCDSPPEVTRTQQTQQAQAPEAPQPATSSGSSSSPPAQPSAPPDPAAPPAPPVPGTTTTTPGTTGTETLAPPSP